MTELLRSSKQNQDERSAAQQIILFSSSVEAMSVLNPSSLEMRCEHCGMIVCKGRRFCSILCRDAFHRAANTAPCRQCGIPYYRCGSHRSRGGYCSRKCFAVAREGANSHLYKTGSAVVRCVICGKEKAVKPSEAMKHSTCSAECRTKRRQTVLRNRIASKCEECGVVIEIMPCQLGKKRFCSRLCANRRHSRYLRGPRNGRYIHGKAESDYPPGWTWGFKKAIRRRDGHVCQVCGMTREDHGKALCVHHINYDKNDLSLINLVTICRFCHGKMHGSPLSRKRWENRLSKMMKSRPAQLFEKIDWKPSTTLKLKKTTTISPKES